MAWKVFFMDPTQKKIANYHKANPLGSNKQ
jgi:hypothetical protein